MSTYKMVYSKVILPDVIIQNVTWRYVIFEKSFDVMSRLWINISLERLADVLVKRVRDKMPPISPETSLVANHLQRESHEISHFTNQLFRGKYITGLLGFA